MNVLGVAAGQPTTVTCVLVWAAERQYSKRVSNDGQVRSIPSLAITTSSPNQFASVLEEERCGSVLDPIYFCICMQAGLAGRFSRVIDLLRPLPNDFRSSYPSVSYSHHFSS
jgi:hypothetical protein